MLKIRLQRIGKKHDPSFRVVVTEHTSGPKTGKHVDTVGSYDARKGKGSVQLDKEKITSWILKGAQPSDTVHNLLISKGVIEGEKRDVLPRKKIAEAEAKKEEEKKEKEEAVKAEKESAETSEEASDAPAEETPAEEEKKEEAPKEEEEKKEE
jgi:small subunit ribosomal protein S16